MTKIHRGPTPPAFPWREQGRFAGWFLVLLLAQNLLGQLQWVDRNVVLPVLKLSATAASGLLRLTGAGTRVNGVHIEGPDYSIAVRRGCDPIEPIALLGAGMLPFRAAIRSKVVGLVLGAFVLAMLNTLRIASLFLVGRARSSWFSPLHLEWWPAAMVLTAILIWVFWLRWIERGRGGERA